uniref:Uncharacterized protein n=1 Tax=Arundo donax TaxID=35708 RepID=A0A0A8ZFA4_ARUDO
MPSCSRQPL